MSESENLKNEWPDPFVARFDDSWPNLEEDKPKVEAWAMENKQIKLRVVTWNLCARPPPQKDQIMQKVLPPNKFHVYVIGTEECERSIAQSALNPSKKNWELYLATVIGPNYVPVRSHTLQAIHIMAFVHRGIAHHCSVVTSAAVATGAGNTLGNKGGVAVFLKIGSTRILVVNSHLAAHQNAEKQRNSDYHKISRGIPLLLDRKSEVAAAASAKLSSSSSPPDAKPVGDDKHTVEPNIATKPDAPATGGGAEQKTADRGVDGEGADGATADVMASSAVKTQQQLLEELARAADLPTNAQDAPPEVPASERATSDGGGVPDADDGDEDGDEVVGVPGVSTTSAGRAAANYTTTAPVGADETGVAAATEPGPPSSGGADRPLEQCADAVVFMGDLNYRIKGNRSAVCGSLAADMHDVLLHNDQLRSNMSRSLVLQGFTEPPLTFRPTYKMDIGSDVYDSGPKRRIPAWTDRILFVDRPDVLRCIEYQADMDITTSDHRPVYASFEVKIGTYVNLDEHHNIVNSRVQPQFTSESQVCAIM